MLEDDLDDRFLKTKFLGHLRADLAMLHAVGLGLAKVMKNSAPGEEVFIHRNLHPAGDLQRFASYLQAVLYRFIGTTCPFKCGDILHQQILGHMEKELGDRFFAPGFFDIGSVFSERGQVVAGCLVIGMVVQPVVHLLVVVAGTLLTQFKVFCVGRHDVSPKEYWWIGFGLRLQVCHLRFFPHCA